MDNIACISLWPRWGEFIARGLKQHETRHWPAPQRLIGQLLVIHQGQRWTAQERRFFDGVYRAFYYRRFDFLLDEPPRGKALCICRLIACHRTEDIRASQTPLELAVGGWSDGRFAWEL